MIQNNNIFWNNFNYFLPNSPVKTVSGGLGRSATARSTTRPESAWSCSAPTAGSVKNNQIFGNFMWGVAAFSDPFNEGDDAINKNNQFVDNKMGRDGTDTNQFDFFNDGSGQGQLLQGQQSLDASTSRPTAQHPTSFLYPSCPRRPRRHRDGHG